MKETKEWFVTAPWGNIAVVSWGNPSGEPVLLVHGVCDSAATYIPLVNLLPDKYYYVGVDLPGNGKSDHFPEGLPVWMNYYVVAIDIVVKHLKWKRFAFICHSMACTLGLTYSAVNPGRVTKLILLDAITTFQTLLIADPAEHFQVFAESYYSNYKQYHTFKVYSKSQALNSVKSARGITEEDAEIVLSRNLMRVGDDQYHLPWIRRSLFPISMNCAKDYYAEVFSMHCPPTILINMTNGNGNLLIYRAEAEELAANLERKVENFKIITLEGEHHCHIKNKETIAQLIGKFLDEVFVKSKL